MTANLSMYGFIAALVAFFSLTVLLVISWKGNRAGGFLILASLLSLFWAAVSAYEVANGFHDFVLLLSSELLRNTAWVLFLLQILIKTIKQNNARSFITFSGLTVIAIFIGEISILWLTQHDMQSLSAYINFDVRIMPFLLLSLVGLMLIEQIYRNTAIPSRWPIKYLCIGLGGMFAYDFYLFADALLQNKIDVDIWGARGYINTIVVPMIAVSAARNPQWTLDIYVSRKFIFHSATIFGAGIYFIAMAIGGYYIKQFGGQWGSIAQLIFLFGAIALLISLLFSGQLRAKLRVFLSKHFFSYRYDYREEWLRLINTLSDASLGKNIYKRVIEAMMRIAESPGGILFLKDDDGEYKIKDSKNLVKTLNTEDDENQSIVSFMLKKKWIIDLSEIETEKEIYQNLILPGWIGEIDNAWLIVPLFTTSILGIDSNDDGKNTDGSNSVDELIGFIVLARSNVLTKINWEVRDLLLTIGRQCAGYFVIEAANNKLLETRQFDVFNRLSAYVVHDLKNIIAQLALIAKNAENYRHNQEFVDDSFITIANATRKMERLLALLRKGRLEVDDKQGLVDLNEALKFVVKEKSGMHPVPSFEEREPPVYVIANEDRLAMVIGHLVQNAQEATNEDGEVCIRLLEKGEWAIVEIEDTGCGMDDKFIRNYLFKPFRTTKGNSGMGIGVYESKEIIMSLGGKLKVSSLPGVGTKFTLFIPVNKKQNDEFVSAKQFM